VILNINLCETLRELDQVAGTRERMAFRHVNESKEIRDSRPQQVQCVLQDVYVGASLSRYQRCLSSSRAGRKLLFLSPAIFHKQPIVPRDSSFVVRSRVCRSRITEYGWSMFTNPPK